jgi:hypothetical protein
MVDLNLTNMMSVSSTFYNTEKPTTGTSKYMDVKPDNYNGKHSVASW